MSTGQVETGLGDAPPSGSEVCSEEDFVRKTASLHHHDLLRPRKGGRDCMLMGSRECNEDVSEFLSTTDYVLV